jgi:hypothetical protein
MTMTTETMTMNQDDTAERNLATERRNEWIDLALQSIDAELEEETGSYIYYAAEIRKRVRVSENAIVLLGRMIESGESSEPYSDPYSEWCSCTWSEELEDEDEDEDETED